jgi:membrane peptidoglycan carboxypeptidase
VIINYSIEELVMKKILRVCSILLSMVLVISVLYFVRNGYELYKESTSESIITKVEEAKNDSEYINIDEISEEFINKLLKSEDKRFYYHNGIDAISIIRAVVKDIKERAFVEGGSTITQQLAKNMFFSFDKKIERKIAELIVSFKLEKELTKDEILETYVNIIYFGEGCYGIKEASYHYYGKIPMELNETEIEELIYTIKSPNNNNPNVFKN